MSSTNNLLLPQTIDLSSDGPTVIVMYGRDRWVKLAGKIRRDGMSSFRTACLDLSRSSRFDQIIWTVCVLIADALLGPFLSSSSVDLYGNFCSVINEATLKDELPPICGVWNYHEEFLL